VTPPGRPLRFARALTPAGAPAEGVVSGGQFIPLDAFASLDGATLTDLLPGWRHNLAVLRSALAGQPGLDPPGSWPADSTRLLGTSC
jgi:hypothetical protein